MNKIALLFALCGVGCCCSAQVIPLDRNVTRSPAAPADSIRQEASPQGTTLTFTLPKPGTATVSIPLDPKAVAGKEIVFSAMIRLENISNPPKSWNGVKFMAAYPDATGKVQYPQTQFAPDTAPWEKYYLRVKFPEKTASAKLVLGLEAVSGTVQFRSLEMNEGPLK